MEEYYCEGDFHPDEARTKIKEAYKNLCYKSDRERYFEINVANRIKGLKEKLAIDIKNFIRNGVIDNASFISLYEKANKKDITNLK